ncbi:MAG: hypothetical protein WDN31_22295 [Hyphomicrobium sp.]
MTEVLLRVLVVAFAAAAIVAVAVIVRKILPGPRFGSLLASKSQRRLGVIEQTAIDAKRKLVLIRRDDVEHLIMTGGPVDIVIESGIGATQPNTQTGPTTSTSARPAHSLGLAAE